MRHNNSNSGPFPLYLRSVGASLASQWGIFMASGFRQIIVRGNRSSPACDGRALHDAYDRGGFGGGFGGGFCNGGGGGGVVVAVDVAVVTVVVVATVPVEVGLSRARGLIISRALRCNKAPFSRGFRYTTVLTKSPWQRYTSHQSPLFHGVSLHGMTWSKHDRYRRRKARWCWRSPSGGGAR